MWTLVTIVLIVWLIVVLVPSLVAVLAWLGIGGFLKLDALASKLSARLSKLFPAYHG